MSETHPAPSVHNLAHEDAGPSDPILAAKLQRAAHLANENCDRATALAHKLSAQLHQAQSRINELELEADGRAGRLWAEAETAVAKLQSDANARIDRTKREAEARIAPVEAEANERLSRVRAEIEDRFSRLGTDLAQAELRTDRAEQWLALIRREIEDHLMPSFAAMHDRLTSLDG